MDTDTNRMAGRILEREIRRPGDCKAKFGHGSKVSQYKFVLCSYRPKKSSPKELMVVEGYTADFADKVEDLEGGKFFFNLVKAGDDVIFAAGDDVDRINWIYKLYNATGQSFKPALPKLGGSAANTDQIIQKFRGDLERALKHGLGDIVQADPFSGFDQSEMFATLQRLTLLHRLNDSYTCLGWFSPGQVFVLDEYCARYGVRGCHRHLCYLNDLLERAENGIMIDPTLLHYSYAFCASHVVGNRPDGVNTVTLDEKERFEEIKSRLGAYLSNQITHFRYCFPFGRPEGAFKSTLTLFERVLSKDTTMPSADPEGSEDVKQAIRDCLRRAALVNYTRLSTYAKVQDSFQGSISYQGKLEVILQLAELCIELIQQNEEHHSEALAWYMELVTEHTEIFWSLFAVDMDDALDAQPPDTWDSFALFQMLNNYLRMETSLRCGKFHNHLTEKFAPLVVRYIDLMESSIARSIDKGFAKETYQPIGHGCAISEEIFWKLQSIQAFIQDLHWPDEMFAEHVLTRLKLMAADMTEAVVTRVLADLRKCLHGSTNLEYVIPPEVCVMINVICRADDQADDLCPVEGNELDDDEENLHYHTNIKTFIRESLSGSVSIIVEKLGVVMRDLLKKLARYDCGKLSSKLLNLLKQNEEVAEDFFRYIVANVHEFREGIEYENCVFDIEKALWEELCSQLCAWLIERQEVALHVYQFKILSNIVEPCRKLFEQEGLTEEDLENNNYRAAYSKLKLEQAMLNLADSSAILERDIEEVKSYESRIQGSYEEDDYD